MTFKISSNSNDSIESKALKYRLWDEESKEFVRFQAVKKSSARQHKITQKGT